MRVTVTINLSDDEALWKTLPADQRRAFIAAKAAARIAPLVSQQAVDALPAADRQRLSAILPAASEATEGGKA